MRKMLWLIAIVAVPLCGAIYQKLGSWSDRRRHMRGRLIPLERGSIYLRDMGSAADGNPTVIFESGIGATSQNWMRLQQLVAAQSRAIAYDRAGLGWSSARVCDPTPRALARDLHTLVAAAGIPGPYLIVGHSFGGLVARQFAAEYPALVAGLVLVDPMRPTDWPPLKEGARGPLERAVRLAGVGLVAARLGAARLFLRSILLGSGRAARLLRILGGEPARVLMDRMLCEVRKMPPEVWHSVAANWARPRFYQTIEAYLRAIPDTVKAMQDAPPLRAPVTVLTPVGQTPLSQSELRAISSNAHQAIAPGSAHWIHLDEPELVLAAIHRMLAGTADAQSLLDLQQSGARTR